MHFDEDSDGPKNAYRKPVSMVDAARCMLDVISCRADDTATRKCACEVLVRFDVDACGRAGRPLAQTLICDPIGPADTTVSGGLRGSRNTGGRGGGAAWRLPPLWRCVGARAHEGAPAQRALRGTWRNRVQAGARGACRRVWAFGASVGNRRAHARARARWTTTTLPRASAPAVAPERVPWRRRRRLRRRRAAAGGSGGARVGGPREAAAAAFTPPRLRRGRPAACRQWQTDAPAAAGGGAAGRRPGDRRARRRAPQGGRLLKLSEPGVPRQLTTSSTAEAQPGWRSPPRGDALVSDKRCDDRECRVPPAYGAVLDTTRRGRDCAEWLAARLAESGDPGCTTIGAEAPCDDIPALVEELPAAPTALVEAPLDNDNYMAWSHEIEYLLRFHDL
ncbi:hypothetical protein BU14_0308s0010 [Porphyra umbilicalis]|uniref:Uncharacterized protein n=1 Tax=Porphyra umbilicalis TaxID=2786 RepID=A0A1X6P0E2_PORUM|nr:hypothetical protein BU14_0308s0010 [Porphyra umbilicalis]|eukprot:OSX74093.1 hypothetical protein BU14_0308s0010 [Porphyra umbilicalis]